MASVNKQKIFYDNIKIEIEAGQYYIEDMIKISNCPTLSDGTMKEKVKI